MPDGVDQILNCMIIREALESPPAAQAEVIRLTREEGLTQTQIAERLELPWERSRRGVSTGCAPCAPP
jgi:DNA-directed RNA polymerase specialized sigma24 family protein